MSRTPVSSMELHPGRWLLLVAVLLLVVGGLIGGTVGLLTVRAVTEVLAGV